MTSPPRRPRPPGAAKLLLWLFLDRQAFEVVAGDLDEEFAVESTNGNRRLEARRRYWREALRSMVARWRPRAHERAPNNAPRRRSSGWLQDARYAVRQVRRSPAFALAAAGMLGLGIAAATTVFTLVNALALRPLPYADASRVAFLLGWNTRQHQMTFGVSYPDALELGAVDAAFSDVAAYRGWNASLSSDTGLPERVQAYRVTPNTFQTLGVDAAIGRTFAPSAGAAVDASQVVLSHGLWARRFGGDPAVVGRSIDLNGQAYTIVGVMPRAFEFPVFNFKGDLWTPLAGATAAGLRNPGASSVVAIGRLAPGVTLEAAQAAADAVMRRIAIERPETTAARGVRVVPMAQLGAGQTAPAFFLLSVAVVLVLLVACANVANLLLARGLVRRRELAVRAALGAGRARLVRQLLLESVLLAAGGGAMGLVLAWWAIDGLRRALPEFVMRVLPGAEAIRLDPDGFAFAAGASFVTALLFGLVPALRAVRPELTDALKSGARGLAGPDPRRRWLRGGLVVGEIAVSAMLLVTTGLLGRSAGRLLAADPGFDAGRLLALSVALPEERYPSAAARRAFFDRFTARLAGLPGVEAVGLVNTLPFSTSDESARVTVEGEPAPEGEPAATGLRLVDAGYFEALGVPVLAGRAFGAQDERTDTGAAIVNRTFVRLHFSGGAGIGRRLHLGDAVLGVVGVVEDVRHSALSEAAEAEVYVPYRADPRAVMSVAIRTNGDPAALADMVRRVTAEIDPAQAVFDVQPMTRMVANSFLPQSLAASLMTVLGAAALLLAALGLYALLTFVVRQRTAEIGVRMALGASRGTVLRLVMRQALWLVASGTAIGLTLGAVAAQGLAGWLFGVGALDPATYLATALALAAAGLAAAYYPARRALRVDPVVALAEP